MTFVLFLFVALVASATAHLFKSALRQIVRFYSGTIRSEDGSAEIGTASLFVLATVSVLAAAAIGHLVQRRWSEHFGIEAVAASARGEGRSMSFRATVLRVLATFWCSRPGVDRS